MKFDFKTIVIVALLLLIGAGIILWPKKQDSTVVRNARDSIARLMEADVIHSMQVRTLQTQLTEYKAEKKVDSTRFVREITVKNQQLARKRVQVDTVFKDSPVLQSYLRTADSVFAMMHQRIDSLEREKQFQEGLYQDLIYIQNKQITNLNMVISQKDVIIAEQEKALRKRNRGAKLWKAAAVTLGVVGVLVGSQL